MRNNTELKLLVTFLLIYSIFIHSSGWNEQTRILAAISIVDNTNFSIDSYANLTGDRIYYKEHYYLDKAPGTSFLLVPVYYASQILTHEKYYPWGADNIFEPQPQFNTTIYYHINTGNVFRLTSIIGTILLSSLYGGLILVMVYKILYSLTEDKTNSLIISIIFGLGTIILNYSTTISGNILSVPLVLTAFYLYYVKRSTNYNIQLLCGILLGFSVVIDYLYLFFVLLFFFYALKSMRRKAAYLFLGIVIGILPLIIYNWSLFGTPFIIPLNYIDPQMSPCSYGRSYYSYCYPDKWYLPDISHIGIRILGVLILPYRGIFFYMPFLLFSILGINILYKKNRDLAIFVALTFVIYIIANSHYEYWWGGGSFGPRYLLIVIPFLSIPIIYFIENNKNIYLNLIFIFLVLVSIFHIFLGTSTFWEGVIYHFFENNSINYVEWYSQKFKFHSNKPIVLLNPLYKHYLPAFLDHGPITRFFDGLISEDIPDIRDSSYLTQYVYLAKIPIGLFYVKSNIFGIFLLLVIFIIMWKTEINLIIGRR